MKQHYQNKGLAPNETMTYIFESQFLFALYSGKQMSSMNDLLKIG